MNATKQEPARLDGAEDPLRDRHRWNTPQGWLVVAVGCLLGSLISLTWGLTQWQQHGREAAVARIQVTALQTARPAPPTRLLVDVRPTAAYVQSHIAGAISLPEAELAQRIGILPLTEPVILYCA